MILSVLCPTYNNPQQLTQMVNSMTRIGFFDKGDRELVIVNNGKQPVEKDFATVIAKRTMQVVNCEENRGWEGGLIEGLKVARSDKFVCFQNDDVHIPNRHVDFYDNLMVEGAGAVGPITTCAAGIQNIYAQFSPVVPTEVRWLIGFCMMLDKKTLEEVGGIDETLPGGDDFDLSIRLRNAGKKLFVNPESFIIHHGFQTGIRVHGDNTVEGGWNSQKMSDRTNKALIQKHGFKTFIETMMCQVVA